ncbi:hypothetical protein B566_EDAN011940 [Ephemera danica]|nr:hypothetical protein B566_EDAN011940 [Ephemera danica]
MSRPETLNLNPTESGPQFPRSSEVPSMPPPLPPQQYSRSVSAPVEPAPLMLSDDEDHMLSMNTPIISPPLAFQDEREARPNRNKLPRSNAFDFPDPDEVTRAFLQASNDPPPPRFSPTKKPSTSPSKAVQQQSNNGVSGLRGQRSSEESSGSSTGEYN